MNPHGSHLLLRSCRHAGNKGGHPQLTARCPSVRGNEAESPRGQGGKEDLRGLGDPKAEPKPLQTLPVPTPSQPNHVLQPRGCGRRLGKTTKTISSRNVHLQLEGTQGQATPQRASGRAPGALTEIPVGTTGREGLLSAHSPVYLVKSSPCPMTLKTRSHQGDGAEPWDSSSCRGP